MGPLVEATWRRAFLVQYGLERIKELKEQCETQVIGLYQMIVLFKDEEDVDTEMSASIRKSIILWEGRLCSVRWALGTLEEQIHTKPTKGGNNEEL